MSAAYPCVWREGSVAKGTCCSSQNIQPFYFFVGAAYYLHDGRCKNRSVRIRAQRSLVRVIERPRSTNTLEYAVPSSAAVQVAARRGKRHPDPAAPRPLLLLLSLTSLRGGS